MRSNFGNGLRPLRGILPPDWHPDLVETLIEAGSFGIGERTATGVKRRRGQFEHADGGTLFLDEVSGLSVAAQAKLLASCRTAAQEVVN